MPRELSTEKDFDSLLQNISDLYSTDELEQIRLAYEDMKSSHKAKAELIRPIVPIREWINNHYYVGPDGENVYSYWKERAIEIFERPQDKRINQIILTGAYGVGKTTFASLVLIRIIYELSCYKHISALFNLFGVSRIAFAYLSVTKEQAQSTGFSLLVEWLDSIPYFREKFKRKNGIDSMVIWPEERLIITYGSVANHFIGMNLLGSILDEANFFSGNSREDSEFKMNSKVAKLYTNIITRSESRFIVGGINYSMSILVSSSTVESSFTEERIEKARNDIHTFISSPSIWDVKPGSYSGEKFLVYTGGDNLDPFVVKDIHDINILLRNKNLKLLSTDLDVDTAYRLLPSFIQINLIQIPVEHKNSFETDIIASLQNLAGISVSSSGKLFSSNVAYNNCINNSLQHPFSREQFILSTTNEQLREGFLPIKSYLFNDITFPNLHMPRFMHVDLGLTGDSLGIAMCYISGWKTIYKTESHHDEDESAIAEEIKVPVLEYDFMLRINPPKKPNRISLSKVRDFIVYLRNVKRVRFGKITFDQFQSEQIRQELAELNFEVDLLSVDRTPDAYLSFVNLIYENRVKFYDYEPFKKELFTVIYYPGKKKVDHPVGMSKDVADAVVGSAFNAIKSEDKSDIDNNSLMDLFIGANRSEQSKKDVIANALSVLTDMLGRS
jgi:hypothetical protein